MALFQYPTIPGMQSVKVCMKCSSLRHASFICLSPWFSDPSVSIALGLEHYQYDFALAPILILLLARAWRKRPVRVCICYKNNSCLRIWDGR
jgi:hypothetical protein